MLTVLIYDGLFIRNQTFFCDSIVALWISSGSNISVDHVVTNVMSCI